MTGKRWFTLGLGCWLLFTAAASAGPTEAKWDVGIRDSYLRGIGEPDIWSAADAIGVTQIEVAVDKTLGCKEVFESSDVSYSIATPEGRQKLGARFAEKKKSICAFCTVHRFNKDESDRPAVEWIGKVAEAARDLGVPVVMVPVPGGRGMSDDEFIERGKRFLGALVPIAKRTGVHIALENLQLFWNRVEVLDPVLKSLPTDRVGLGHDVTNMYWYGHPIDKIYEMTETIAPYVRRYCHAKNERYPEDLNALIEAGYISRQCLRCPSTRGARECDYVYLKAHWDSPGRTIVACDRKGNHEDWRNVLYLHGSCRGMTEAGFQAELAREHNEQFAEHLRKIEGQ